MGVLDPSRPPAAGRRLPDLVMGAGPSVQPSWARTLLPAGLQNVNASNVSVPSLSGC